MIKNHHILNPARKKWVFQTIKRQVSAGYKTVKMGLKNGPNVSGHKIYSFIKVQVVVDDQVQILLKRLDVQLICRGNMVLISI
jgi:hypothetical protein